MKLIPSQSLLALGAADFSGPAKPQMSKHQKVRGKKDMIIMLTLTHPSIHASIWLSSHPCMYWVSAMRGADLGTSVGLAPLLQYEAEGWHLHAQESLFLAYQHYLRGRASRNWTRISSVHFLYAGLPCCTWARAQGIAKRYCLGAIQNI